MALSPFVPTVEQMLSWSNERSRLDRATTAEWDLARVELLKEFGPGSKELLAFDHCRRFPDLTTYKRLMADVRGPTFDGRVGYEAGHLLGRMRMVSKRAVGIDPATRVCLQDEHGDPRWPGPGWW